MELTPNGQVDATTQNALIKANARNVGYVLWVQVALNELQTHSLLPGDAVPLNGILGQTTRNAIRRFQQRLADGAILPFKIDLRVDGVVGPKTEAHLTALSGIEPPGDCV